MTKGDWVDLGQGLKGYYAAPAGAGPHPGVVVYIEAFGVNSHFKKLTERFADAGYATITPDIYDGETYAYDDLQNAIGKLKALDDGKVMAQTKQALDFLKSKGSVDMARVGTNGYCMGGRYVFLANAALAGRFKAAAAFYGGGIGPVEDFAGRKTLLDRVGEMTSPIMLFYGTQDQSIKPEEIGRIAEALTKADKAFTVTVYPGVGHGFFCEERASYDKGAAEQSWQQMLAFFGDRLGG